MAEARTGGTKQRTVLWLLKEDPFGVEFAEVTLREDSISAVGVAIGTDPVPYRLDYIFETASAFVTSQLTVEARGEGWRRSLNLKRGESGIWSIATVAEGEAPLPPLGRGVSSGGALDCDLGLSPLTNSMPVLRHGLLSGGGPVDFVMAWVSVPDLGVHSSKQRYTFMHTDQDRHIIRFEDSDGFVADLTFDGDGLVLDYPGLARRLVDSQKP